VAKQLMIEVCGLETLVVQNNDIYKTFVAPSSGQFEILSTTVSTDWFTLTKTASNSDCVVTSYGMYSDSDGTTLLSSIEILFDKSGTAVNNNYPIKISRSTSFGLTNVYLKATTTGDISSIKHWTVEVCGVETLVTSDSLFF
jgi:hypothetical protein